MTDQEERTQILLALEGEIESYSFNWYEGDWAILRCAELRFAAGVQANPYLTWEQDRKGDTIYTVHVRLPDGSVEHQPTKAEARKNKAERVRLFRYECFVADRIRIKEAREVGRRAIATGKKLLKRADAHERLLEKRGQSRE